VAVSSSEQEALSSLASFTEHLIIITLVAFLFGVWGSFLVIKAWFILKDDAKTKQTNRELRDLTRALRTLSECNQALVRAPEEAALLADICRILVEHGGYRMAWIGFALQDDAKTVQPMAQAGCAQGYLETAQITWADTERGRGPTGIAIRTGQPAVMNNIQTDPAFAP